MGTLAHRHPALAGERAAPATTRLAPRWTARTLGIFAVAVRAREASRAASPCRSSLGGADRERARAPSLLMSFGSPYLISQVPSVPGYLLAWTGDAAERSRRWRRRSAARRSRGTLPGARASVLANRRWPRDGQDGRRATGGNALPASGHDRPDRDRSACGAACRLSARPPVPSRRLDAHRPAPRLRHRRGRGARRCRRGELSVACATSTARDVSASMTPRRPDAKTLYDLASLTKVVGLTTGVMLAVSEGRLELDAPVDRYVPGLRRAGQVSSSPSGTC